MSVGRGKVFAPGPLLTWLGDSQKLRYGSAGHLAVTEGTHHQYRIEGPCVECEAVWGLWRGAMIPRRREAMAGEAPSGTDIGSWGRRLRERGSQGLREGPGEVSWGWVVGGGL